MTGNNDRQRISSHRLSDCSGRSRTSNRGCKMDIGPSFAMGNGSCRIPAPHLKVRARGGRYISEISRFATEGRKQSIGKVRKKSVVSGPEFTRIRMLGPAVSGHRKPAGPDHALRFLQKVEGGLGWIENSEAIHGLGELGVTICNEDGKRWPLNEGHGDSSPWYEMITRGYPNRRPS